MTANHFDCAAKPSAAEVEPSSSGFHNELSILSIDQEQIASYKEIGTLDMPYRIASRNAPSTLFGINSITISKNGKKNSLHLDI